MEILWRSFDFFASFSFFAQSLPCQGPAEMAVRICSQFSLFSPGILWYTKAILYGKV